MPRKAKKKRVYRTKEETKERKRLKQKQKQQQNVNIKVGSSGSAPQSIPTVISNTHYVPQQQNNDNLLALLMKSFGNRQEQPLIKELPKTFSNAGIGEDVPQQSLVDTVTQNNIRPEDEWLQQIIEQAKQKNVNPEDEWIQNIIEQGRERKMRPIAEDLSQTFPEDFGVGGRLDKLKQPPITEPFVEEDEEVIEIIPKTKQRQSDKEPKERRQSDQEPKERKQRDKPKEKLYDDLESLVPDKEMRKQAIKAYKKSNGIKKSYQNFTVKELEDLLSYLTNK